MVSSNYEKLIPRRERDLFEEALEMQAGYLLDFSDKTFSEFFYEAVKIDPESNTGLFSGHGTSKAKRLRAFIEKASPGLVAKVLRELWECREANHYGDKSPREELLRENYFLVVSRFEGGNTAIDASAIETFEPNETLEELVASIRRDLDAKRPQVALDRLHTYCMKRFGSLVKKYGGGECGKDDPLHSRVGRYVKLLREKRNLTPMSERIIKSSISVFQEFNPIRNDHSLAHDNEKLIDMDEARFIFDSVAAFLRFAKAVDTRSFED